MPENKPDEHEIGRREFLIAGALAPLATTAPSLLQTRGLSPSPSPLLDPDAPVRIGIIGRTGHLSMAVGTLDQIKGAQVTAVAFEDGDWEFNCDGSRRSAPYDFQPNQRWIERQSWNTVPAKVYETYQEMLEKEEFDVAVVCLPYARNAHATMACARAGVHVLTEKPVAVTRSDLERVEETLRRHPIRLTAMFAMRYFEPFHTMHKAIGRGEIGSPCVARAQKSYKFGPNRPWFYRSREIYGSTILWVGIHAIDYIRWTTGLEIVEVSGFHQNLVHSEYPGLEDSAALSMKLEGGAVATLTMDFLRPETASTHGDDRLRIAGSLGVIEKQLLGDEVELVTQSREPHLVQLEEPPRELFPDFVAELRGQARHLIGPDEALRVTRICIAATEAADSGRVVPV